MLEFRTSWQLVVGIVQFIPPIEVLHFPLHHFGMSALEFLHLLERTIIELFFSLFIKLIRLFYRLYECYQALFSCSACTSVVLPNHSDRCKLQLLQPSTYAYLLACDNSCHQILECV